MLCSFLLGTGTGNVIPSSETISGSLTQSLRCLENSSFFSSQHCKWDQRRHWSFIWLCAKWREWFSNNMVTCWHLHLCSLFGSGDSMWTGWLQECPINWQHPQDIELGQKFVLSAWQSLFNAFQCSALSGSELEQATWFLAARGFLDALTQQHQKQNPLPNTRFEVSGKLQLFQPSTLQRRHYSLTWPFAKMETVKRMLLSQWSLLDICICACLLGTDDWYELDSCTNVPSFDGQHQQGIELRQGMAKARKSYLMFGDVIPGNDTFSEANQTNFVTKGLKFLPDFSFLSSQHCKGDTTHWPDPLQKWKEENASLTVVTCWNLHLCSLSGSGDSMWTGWLHECLINWWATLARHWTRANVCSFSMAKFVKCSTHSCPEPEQAMWFLAARGFLDALTQQHQKQNPLPNTRFEVSGKLQLFQLSTLQRRHYSLTWLFAKMETVKRMLLSQWSLLDICTCACLLGTDDWYELDSCTNVPSIDGQHQQGIDLM